MSNDPTSCPLDQNELLDRFFMDHRNQLLEIAAFLDRLDRSRDKNAEGDFRLRAFRNALQELTGDNPGRVESIQMMLSDPRTDFLEERDRQNAEGVSPHAPGAADQQKPAAPEDA
ncbi:MAG: hypothetical protein GWM98_12720 [Nitrospinaceae bacterium]|nr:hypothetical protein [Nitrospinaceae bacterium]